MKKVFAIVILTFFSTIAFSQAAKNKASQPVVATAMVTAATSIPDVLINPNPVKGQNFSLELQNLEKGKYNIYIFDNNGKKYLVKTINTEGGSSTETIDLPKDVTSGTYILQVLSKTTRFSKKM